jgi:hypothetical protein
MGQEGPLTATDVSSATLSLTPPSLVKHLLLLLNSLLLCAPGHSPGNRLLPWICPYILHQTQPAMPVRLENTQALVAFLTTLLLRLPLPSLLTTMLLRLQLTSLSLQISLRLALLSLLLLTLHLVLCLAKELIVFPLYISEPDTFLILLHLGQNMTISPWTMPSRLPDKGSRTQGQLLIRLPLTRPMAAGGGRASTELRLSLSYCNLPMPCVSDTFITKL